MNTFIVTQRIAAPVEAVWAALADIGSIADWNPGVVASHTTSAQTDGLGASRYCDLGRAGDLHEEVVAWEPERKLTLRITDSTLPFESTDIEFTLRPDDDGTVVTVAPVYALKYGPLGRLLDRLMVRRTYERGMEALLAGLKQHVESVAAA
ncbi:MAG: SRPBCC family protein [Rhodothermaceae bacterium]|nr:SRPBCC family protein [Rhodothermaceae bacterium]